MKEVENFKRQILKEYPRMDLDSEFTFRCHPGVPCFNECCGDVNIFLTPYDVIRLKTHLGIRSTEFLKKYTIAPMDRNLKYPVILLQMGDDEKKKCPFVGPQGCTVYADRPWACRMYPLGMASPGEDSDELEDEFYFLLKENHCKGFLEPTKFTVRSWLADQGIEEYNRIGDLFKGITTHKFFRQNGQLTPDKVEMFFLVCYDIDRFRKFVFESSLLKKFIVDEQTIAAMKDDDIALLEFGCRFLHFSLFREPTMKIRDEAVENKKKELLAKGKLSRDKEDLSLE